MITGAFLLGMAAFSYWYFSGLEQTGGVGRVKWWMALLYTLGGKWLVCSLFGVVGVTAIIMAIVGHRQ